VFEDPPLGRALEVIPVVIAEGVARRFWPGEEPLGRQFRLFPDRVHEVVGVARETRHHSLAQVAEALLYVPATFRIRPDSTGEPPAPPAYALVVRTTTGADVTQEVMRIGRQIDPNVMLVAASLGELLQKSLRPARLASVSRHWRRRAQVRSSGSGA
jgi:hypothetical protein